MDDQNQSPDNPLEAKITRRQLLSAAAVAPLALAAGAFVADLSPDEVVPEIVFPELIDDVATGRPRLSAFFLASDTLELVSATVHATFLGAAGEPLEERDVLCYRDLSQGPYVTGDLVPSPPDGTVSVACDAVPVTWQYGELFTPGGCVSVVPVGYRHDKQGFLIADVVVGVVRDRPSMPRRWPLESLECDLVAYRGAGWFGTPCRMTLLTKDDDPILVGEQRKLSVALPARDATRCEWRGASWEDANMWERNRFRTYPFDEVTLGRWRGQDLTWLVLEEADDRMTLISKCVVEATVCYDNPTPSPQTAWSICLLKRWLNEDFLYAAFSDEERAHLVPDEEHDAVVALLTAEQFDRHFAELDPRDRMAYALSGLIRTENYDPNNGSCAWWLLDTDEEHICVACVDGGGNKTFTMPRYSRGVRPVVTVKKEKAKK